MAVILLRRKNYLVMIENAARGAQNCLFRNTYALLEGQERDITSNGTLSSGRFVSAILYLNKLIEDLHVTVEGTEKDMLNSGWYETKNLKEGAVLVWEPLSGINGGLRTHIGFYLGNDRAVSNNFKTGIPTEHHTTFGATQGGTPNRGISKIYWHPVLSQQ